MTYFERRDVVVEDPPIAKALFASTKWAWIWIPVRILLGWQWLQSGLGKIGNPAWMDSGAALRGFWESAVAVPESGRPPIAFDWYRSFIQSLLDAEAYQWFGSLIAIGETTVGIALILGAFTGIAAFFGAFMNWNFIMAGSASTNGLLGVAGILIILAWKVAGYYGLDYFLLPWLGTPWGTESEDEEASSAKATSKEKESRSQKLAQQE